jgi:hypothetical protein
VDLEFILRSAATKDLASSNSGGVNRQILRRLCALGGDLSS